MEKILSAHFRGPGKFLLDDYQRAGGYGALRRALREMAPQQVLAWVKESGLRGRGGAGFPTGSKWGFVPRGTKQPIYLVCNADESEPGTCKDIVLLEQNPHLMLEGMLLAAYALQAHAAFLYLRGEFPFADVLLRGELEKMRREKLLGRNILGSDFHLEILITRGAGAYICGEETSQLESLEGKRGYPRNKPPFPAVAGLFRCPTVVNNVETLANLPFILERGPQAYRQLGTAKSPGTRLFSVSGRVERPGVYELPHGFPLRALIGDVCGGVSGGRPLKAVIPGGSSVPVLAAHECDISLDFEAVAAAGSMLGSAGVIVLDETVDMVEALANLARFYAHESCGQCTQCREGTKWMLQILEEILAGRGKAADLDLLLEIAAHIKGQTICPLGDAAAMPVDSFVRKFRPEFLAKMGGRR